MSQRSPASFRRGRIVTALPTLALYAAAAVAEIAGCFAVWAWMRQGASVLWLVPGGAALAMFARPPGAAFGIIDAIKVHWLSVRPLG